MSKEKLKVNRLVVAWDVDDTLIIPNVAGYAKDVPNYENIMAYKWFQKQGCYMIIWSGSGVDWATTWAEKLGLKFDMICRKGQYEVDIAIDDCDVSLGAVNVKVKRENNHISRKEWNETKK